jgi:hypothetical protein
MKERLRNWFEMWGIVIGILLVIFIPLIVFGGYSLGTNITFDSSNLFPFSGIIIVFIGIFVGSYWM